MVIAKDQIKLGVIGLSEGNGHPFSFSAIINGYNPEAMKNSGWIPIFNYLERRHASEFGFPGVAVTHVWTQDPDISQKISSSTKVAVVCDSLEQMVEVVDGVLIARDDFEIHKEMAVPFLKAGRFVFVDKPLDLDLDHLRFFQPYLESGQLMSCAGLRYARELDVIRAEKDSFGKMLLVRAAVSGSWEKYGVHMLDGIFSIIPFSVVSVRRLPAEHISICLTTQNGPMIQIDCLEKTVKTFQFDFWGENRREQAEVSDNFSAFRRMLGDFISMIRTGQPMIDPELTLNVMKTLMAGRLSAELNREVNLSEINI